MHPPNSSTPGSLYLSHDEPGSPAIPMAALNVLLAVAYPWKSRHRSAFLALLALLALSTFIFCVAYPSLAAPMALRRPDDAPPRVAALAASRRWKVSPGAPRGAQVRLSPAQELAAIASFLASLPQNVIPPTVDPLQPIDPQLVLDFDTRGARARAEVQAMVDDVWARNPVVLFAKFYSPESREIKSIIAGLDLYPAPTVFDVDRRDDSSVLMPLLMRITTHPTFPILLIGGTPVGPLERIRALKASGRLREMVMAAGGVVDGAKRRRGRK